MINSHLISYLFLFTYFKQLVCDESNCVYHAAYTRYVTISEWEYNGELKLKMWARDQLQIFFRDELKFVDATCVLDHPTATPAPTKAPTKAPTCTATKSPKHVKSPKSAKVKSTKSPEKKTKSPKNTPIMTDAPMTPPPTDSPTYSPTDWADEEYVATTNNDVASQISTPQRTTTIAGSAMIATPIALVALLALVLSFMIYRIRTRNYDQNDMDNESFSNVHFPIHNVNGK